ncbi:MAG: hypothetical protein LBJ17_02380 [Dysgonamonadaceae bacterium]|jgi:hypothetical protein|nr:hypothetical protein [Dysgonamonadaceae bacterium]
MNRNSSIETGIAICVSNFKTVISHLIASGDKYNPQNRRIMISTLQDQLSRVQTSIDVVFSAQSQTVIAEGILKETFAPLRAIITRVLAVVNTLSLSYVTRLHITNIIRKIRYRRARLMPVVPQNKAGEPVSYITVSQSDFTLQITFLSQLIDQLYHLSDYAPDESDITISGLLIQLSRMRIASDLVTQSHRRLSLARDARNILLYAPVSGMMDTASYIKNYVRSLFGAENSVYKKINKLKFSKVKLSSYTHPPRQI